jgi:Zn-finger protein
MDHGRIVPIDYPFLTGHCFYCYAEVPCDDGHAEPSFGRSWRLRCHSCQDAGANHRDDMAAKLLRAVAEQLGRN